MVPFPRSPVLVRLAAACVAALLLQRLLGEAWVQPPRSCVRELGVAMAGKAEDGIFTPVVQAAKEVMGEKELTRIRGQVIKEHGDLMQAFLDTSDSPFGKVALRQLFDFADKDGSGQLDKEELQVALKILGFVWFEDETKVEKIVSKGDADGDELIDFEEFVEAAPGVLKQNLIRLAKSNGGKLGFMS